MHRKLIPARATLPARRRAIAMAALLVLRWLPLQLVAPWVLAGAGGPVSLQYDHRLVELAVSDSTAAPAPAYSAQVSDSTAAPADDALSSAYLSMYDNATSDNTNASAFAFEWVVAQDLLRWKGPVTIGTGEELCLSYDVDNHTFATIAPTHAGQPSNSIPVLPAVLRPCASATGWRWNATAGSLRPLRNTSLCLTPQPLLGPPPLLLPCGVRPWGSLPHDMTPPPHPACDENALSDVRHKELHHHHQHGEMARGAVLAAARASCQNGTDVAPGHDLPGSYPNCTGPAACAIACKKESGCKAWVFDPCFQSMCYLKAASSPVVPKPCVCSALMPVPSPPKHWRLQHIAGGNSFTIQTQHHFSMHQSDVYGAIGALSLASEETQPLVAAAIRFAPLGAVVPAGWMRQQLEAQRWGFAGNEYPAGGNYSAWSAWIDGDKMGGCGGFMAETYPYWLNGMIPLSTLLGDAADNGTLRHQLKQQVRTIVVRAQGHQNWLGPIDARSQGVPRGCWCIWSTYRMMTGLLQYMDVADEADAKAIGEMLFNWARVLADFLAHKPILPADFDSVRWEEAATALQALLDSPLATRGSAADRNVVRTAMELLATQGMQWPAWINSRQFPTTCDSASWCNYADWIVFIGQGVHGVNVASGIAAAPALHRMGRPGMLDAGRSVVEKLEEHHGTAMGATTSCECVAGKSPAKGTETCTVVETVNSLSMLLSASGDMRYADRAEHIAMNGFGAAFLNGSMNSMKYFQNANVLKDTFAPVYECCLSNHAQGWPRFAARQMAYTSNGEPLVLFYFPSTVSLPLHSADKVANLGQLEMTMHTAYPFDDKIYIDVKVSTATTLWVRVPGWASHPTAEFRGEIHPLRNGTLAPFKLLSTASADGHMNPATGATRIMLHYPMTIRTERRWNNAIAITRGPLLYSLALNYTSRVVKTCPSSPLRPQGMDATFDCTNELTLLPNETYQYAIDPQSLSFATRGHELLPMPVGQGQWNVHSCNVSLRTTAKLVKAEAWDEVATTGASTTPICKLGSPLPSSALVDPAEHATLELELLPYGVTDLRVTELPTY